MEPLPIGDYDPSRVVQIIGDVEPKAYGPDSRISITPSGPRFSIQQGQDGHIVRVKNRAIYYILTFTLMRTDPANDKLAALHQADVDNALTLAGKVVAFVTLGLATARTDPSTPTGQPRHEYTP